MNIINSYPVCDGCIYSKLHFCKKYNIEGNFNIISYLEKKNIPKSRKRINEGGYISSKGNPIYVYEGIRLRAKYRVSKSDSE